MYRSIEPKSQKKSPDIVTHRTEIYSDDLRTQALARPLALRPRSRLALPRGAASNTSKVD